MSLLLGAVILVAVGVAGYIERKVVVAKVEAEYNTAHAWIQAEGATYEHKVVAEAEHVWTVVKGEVKGIGATLTKAVEDLKSKIKL